MDLQEKDVFLSYLMRNKRYTSKYILFFDVHITFISLWQVRNISDPYYFSGMKFGCCHYEKKGL